MYMTDLFCKIRHIRRRFAAHGHVVKIAEHADARMVDRFRNVCRLLAGVDEIGLGRLQFFDVQACVLFFEHGNNLN